MRLPLPLPAFPLLAFPLLALLATVVSVAVQGFAYGVSNNVFHIPLILHDYAQPGFANDAYAQTLPRYVSPIFPALSVIATRDNLPTLFLLVHAIGRWATLWAMLRILALLGTSGPRLVFAIAVLVVAPGLMGITELGRQELLPGYFTHTALAQAALLWSIVHILKARFVAACMLAAVAFDINAFVGVWAAGPLLAALLVSRPSRRTAATGLLTGAAIAAPVAIWIATVAASDRTTFDYVAFLRAYYPNHFFIDAASRSSILQLAAALASGVVAARLTGARLLLWAGTGLGAVFVAGVAVGAAATSPLLLNLHLLRVDGPLILLSACAALAVAVQAAGRDPFRTACAIVIAGALLVALWPAVLAALLLLHIPAGLRDRLAAPIRPIWDRLTRRPTPILATAALLLAAWGTLVVVLKHRPPDPSSTEERYFIGQSPAFPEWRDTKLWARDHTPPAAVFLVPEMLQGFEQDALRPAWVDWKAGAAAMWAPSFHETWSARMEAVTALTTPEARIRFACAQHLDYAVLDDRRHTVPGHTVAGVAPVFRNRAFAIYPTRDCPLGP